MSPLFIPTQARSISRRAARRVAAETRLASGASAVGFALALAAVFALAPAPARAVAPEITAWRTANSSQFAKVVEYTGGTATTTWPATGLTNNGGGVSSPSYSDIQQIRYSTNWVYINASGLASYNMGPWYLSGTTIFGLWPANQNYLMRFPRTPTPATTFTATSLGNVGLCVNGVGIFNALDAYTYKNSTGQDAMNGPSGGDGIWYRTASVELPSFDPAYAHSQQQGAYHFHGNPKGLRLQLNDNITYNSATGTYAEATGTLHHSPILGFALDGYPIYGPYGYSSAMDSGSAIRRMTSGFQVRNGTNGTTNLTATGRRTIPQWSATLYGRSTTLTASQYGPNVAGQYTLGRYAEDHEYLGDVGKVQGVDFDLDVHNGRTCVTPEYPGGTYAYFITIDATGGIVYPYTVGPTYYGVPSGGSVSSVSEATTTYFLNLGATTGVPGWGQYTE